MPVSPRRLAAVALLLLAGCTSPLLDQPSKQRHTTFMAPPLFHSSSSPDGTSWQWNALIWLAGQDVESDRRHSRFLPIWWHDSEPPYLQTTMLFPLWFEREAVDSTTRFFSILYGYVDTPEMRTDYVLPPIFWMERSKTSDYRQAGLFLIWNDEYQAGQYEFTLFPLLGLVTGLHMQLGLPPEGVMVPALDRSSSWRMQLLDVLGIITLAGYDDVGDRRDIRALTFFSSETLSILRSWRGRGDDPFVREWLFPLYMNVQDAGEGWAYVGPLWGEWHEGATRTDWWLLGLLARNEAPEGNTWRVLGIPIVSP